MSGPPDLDITEFGWRKDEETKSLTPVYSSQTKAFIPAKLGNLLACRCSGANPCKSLQCGCHRNQMPCSMFCNCYLTECLSSITPTSDSAAPDDNTALDIKSDHEDNDREIESDSDTN